MLQLAAATGEIDLKYLDESGFCVWSEPSYTYYQRGEQKRLEQTQHRGRRLSIIGFFQPLISFVYGLVIGGVDRKSYIQMMEQEAREAETSGCIRVIVQDNGSIHKCKEVQRLWSKWEDMGLYIFFLPAYCSEMNPIELEWQHIKKDELAAQMFDDELELAYAVINGVEARAEKGNYSTQRMKFNSKAARLHSFPDWVDFRTSKLAAHKAIGNSVPPLLAYAISSQVWTHLEKQQSFSSGDATRTTIILRCPAINRFVSTQLLELQVFEISSVVFELLRSTTQQRDKLYCGTFGLVNGENIKVGNERSPPIH